MIVFFVYRKYDTIYVFNGGEPLWDYLIYLKKRKENNNLLKENNFEKVIDRRIPFNVSLSYWNEVFKIEMELEIFLGGDSVNTEETDEEYNTYEYLIDNQKDIIVNIVNELYNQYPELRKEYGYSKEDEEKYMPSVTNLDEYIKLINPHTIHILPTKKDGYAYYGIEFNCKWDDHVVGVMMYKSRVVKIGMADSAILNWIAERDMKNNSK